MRDLILDLLIGGASVKDTLTLQASSLRDAKQSINPLFTQERDAASAAQLLDRLLATSRRPTENRPKYRGADQRC